MVTQGVVFREMNTYTSFVYHMSWFVGPISLGSCLYYEDVIATKRSYGTLTKT